ncbi:MAG: ABC transporter substrate-binding protein [Chloroflexi bacterium]|nr:ABC transporter substrate-binding protein [Chloroflexota bacterium]
MYYLRAPLAVLIALGLILASCAPTVAPTPTAKPAAPAAQPTSKPAPTKVGETKPAPSPAAKPAAPTPSPKPAADQPRYGGILNISAQADPISLDMQQESSYLVSSVVQCPYSGVTQFDSNDPEKMIGDLARNWDISKDGLTYTFSLNEGVKFHDGSPLSAEDIKFSFERMMRPPRGILAPRRADLAAVDRIEAPDKNTVKFLLKYPSGAFLNVISSGWMVVYSKAYVEKKGDMKKDVMGTGPYKLKNYSIGVSLEYVKNPDYFVKGRPYLDGIVFYIIKDAGTRLAAFRTGQVKLTGPGASGLTAPDAEIVKKTLPQAILMSYPAFSRTEIMMQNKQKPWDDVRVRRAVHLAIDRQLAITVLEQGYGELASHFPGDWGIPRDELLKMPGWRQPKDQDMADARKLLAEAGFPSGMTVKTLVRAEKQFEELSVFVADQLAKVGMKLELEVKDAAVRTDMLVKGTWEFHPRVASLAFPDPENVGRYWTKPIGDDWGQNWQRFTDEKVWELFDKQSRAGDPSERKKIVRELDLRLIELAAMPIVFWRTAIIGMWPEVKNRGKVAGFFSFQKYQDIWLAK